MKLFIYGMLTGIVVFVAVILLADMAADWVLP